MNQWSNQEVDQEKDLPRQRYMYVQLRNVTHLNYHAVLFNRKVRERLHSSIHRQESYTGFHGVIG